MKNKMSEVAKLLGVELNEEFWLADSKNGYERIRCKYKITRGGLERKYYFEGAQWGSSALLEDIISGRYEIIKMTISILDEAEKRYLSNIIKPFINKVKFIVKIKKFSGNYEYISISYIDSTGDYAIILPDFKEGTMYRGMKIGKKYALKELGL